MQKLIASLLLFSLVIFSCSDDPEPINAALKAMNIEVGNFWVYEWYEVANGDSRILLKRRDSVYVSETRQRLGKTMWLRSGSFMGSEQIQSVLLYDSANTVYGYPGKEVFFTLDKSLTVTKTLGTEPVAIGYYALEEGETKVTVPSGEFKVVNFRGRIEPTDPNYPFGIRYNDNYYAKGIGLVMVRTHFYSSPNTLEMRLVSYGQIKPKS